MSAGQPSAAEAGVSARQVRELALRGRFGPLGRVALAVAVVLVAALAVLVVQVLAVGIGVWGVNIPFVWGFDLISYVFWIGIANGASLFAAVLVIRLHELRTAVNRFAEGLALFAVICAGLFPIIHLGRPQLWFWMFPYPATHEVWPQFRSPLTWDFWAISTHVIVTTLLWYIGLIPDLATLRDRARRLRWKRVFGVAALGWRGSARHWAHHQAAYRLVAIMVLPLILVMQTIVAFEFATTLVPEWHDTRLPLHFIVTGITSGLASVLLIALLLRFGLPVEAVIDDGDVRLLTRLVAACGLVQLYVYGSEMLFAGLDHPQGRAALVARLAGEDAPVFWSALVLTGLLPQALWAKRVAFAGPAAGLIALGTVAGVWLDRFGLIVAGVRQDYLPSMRRDYAPTFPEWMLLPASVGLLCLLLLLFARFLPVVSMFETRHAETEVPEG